MQNRSLICTIYANDRKIYDSILQIAEEEAAKRSTPLRVKKIFVLAAQLVTQHQVKMAAITEQSWLWFQIVILTDE